MAPAPGTRLGPYEIASQIGMGWMGEVYRACDTRLNRTVAIKVLPTEVAAAPDSRARFEREARAVAALDHPHICGIYDVGVVDGVHYLVMPHVEAPRLRTGEAAAGGGPDLDVGDDSDGDVDAGHGAVNDSRHRALHGTPTG